jgi:hypothetical protein
MALLLRVFKPIPMLILVPIVVSTCFVVAFPALAPAKTHNITIPVPDGSTLYGDTVLCTPGSPRDILIFYVANYFAHALTVKSYPGESGHVKYLLALFYPVFGLLRGLNAIARHGRFRKGVLAQAAQSGALCMVVRNGEWEPDDGVQLTNVRLKWRGSPLAFLSV